MKLFFATFFFFTFGFSSSRKLFLSSNFSVLDYGAIGNGISDDSQAFLKAWEAVCGATRGIPTLHVPLGKAFLLKPLKFEGPCKSSQIIFNLRGTLVAPKGKDVWPSDSMDKWIQFSSIDGLIINGGGQIDGQGSFWWNDCHSDCERPTALFIHNCQRLQLSDMMHINSAKNHISINACNDANISKLKIIAPQESPNTDGIDIARSNYVYIHDSTIGTGDDCIAINNGSSNIVIEQVVCGPGHGISIGSLGGNEEYNVVENIHVRNCLIKDTQNGVRIKTWQGGSGYARNISFEKITLMNAKNPIIIDQHYTALAMNQKVRDVKVSDVTYRHIHGTSANENAIVLDCSSSGCNNIIMEDVSIKNANPGEEAKALCQNVEGRSSFATPTVPCLSNNI